MILINDFGGCVSIKHCRVCQQELDSEPLLQYKNMPKSAQFLPEKGALHLDKGSDIDICQCSGCGLIQLNNEPVHYYREVIRATSVSAEMKSFREQQFKQWVDKYKLTGKTIFEFGCGAGEFMSIMNSCDVQVFGMEHGSDSIEKCVQQGLTVEQGFIESTTQQLESGPFDAFYMLNFLEHVPDVNTVLKGIANNLVDGAIGLVEVPNFDMILRNNLFSEFISDHLYYFTQRMQR